MSSTVIYPKSSDPILADLYRRLEEIEAEAEQIGIEINKRTQELRAQQAANDPAIQDYYQKMIGLKNGTDAYSQLVEAARIEGQQAAEERRRLEAEQRRRDRANW